MSRLSNLVKRNMNQKQANAILENLRQTEKALYEVTQAMSWTPYEDEYRDLEISKNELELEKADLLLEICSASEETV